MTSSTAFTATSGGLTSSTTLSFLDFHALSITLLATTACHNGWDYDRLTSEWDTQRVQVLRTDYNGSLPKTIELSLASPTFRSLGTEARNLLGVVAFFPQGVDEKNLDWLFPTIPDRKTIFDKFCVLSLAYRSNGFISTLAPLRDYLSPRDPKSSPLLCATRDHYFTRLSADINPDKPGFREARWIISEDVNIEHMLGVLTSIDAESADVWNACIRFLKHLYWHKPRETVLRPKIEGLPDGHPSKPTCLFQLSRLFQLVENHAERKKLLLYALALERERRDDIELAKTLRDLSDANRCLGLYEEGTQQAKESMNGVGMQHGKQGLWNQLSRLFLGAGQLDSAEEAISRTIDLIPEKGEDRLLCQSHRTLGLIHRTRRNKEKAIHHFETALEIASRYDWEDELFWIHHAIGLLFINEKELNNAQDCTEQAKSYVAEDRYKLGLAMKMQAIIWYRQGRLEETKLEATGALAIFEKLGVAKEVEHCRGILRDTEEF